MSLSGVLPPGDSNGWPFNNLSCSMTRYVVRAKAGGRQSARDAAGGRSIKSAGSSLRRYNEAALEKVRTAGPSLLHTLCYWRWPLCIMCTQWSMVPLILEEVVFRKCIQF